MMPDNYDKYDELVEILTLGVTCGSCNERLDEDEMDMYDHMGGISVKGHLEKQWVSIRCTGCGHMWSWDKLLRRGRTTIGTMP